MEKTVVEFTLPFAAIDEGRYKVYLDQHMALIVIKYIPNPCGLREIMKMGVENGTFRLDFDVHGIANMSMVTIELPYERNEYNHADKAEGHHIQSYSLKKDCILFMNRLIDVVRFETRRHWIPFISEKMIPSYSTYVIDKSGKKRNVTYRADFGGGLQFMTITKK